MVPVSDEQFRQALEQAFHELSSQFNVDLKPGSPLRLFSESAINSIMRPNSLQLLLLSGYSDSSLQNALKSLGFSHSQSDLNQIVNSLKEEPRLFKERYLPEQTFLSSSMLIMAPSEMTLTSVNVHAISSCGMGLGGEKYIFGVYTFPGDGSSIDWSLVLRDLFGRGLKESCIIASDDFPGRFTRQAQEAYRKYYHQLCLAHLQRDTRKNLPKRDASEFDEQIR